MESGDQPMAPKPPDQGSGELELVRVKGDSQEVRLFTELIDKDAEKQREMKKGKEKGKKKRGKEKGKKKEKRSKASGWCTKLINCFACGAVEQDEPEKVEVVSVEARQKPQDEQSQKDGLHSSTANEDENGNTEDEHQEVVEVPVEAGQRPKDVQSQKGDLGSGTPKKDKNGIEEEEEQRGGKTEHSPDWTPTSTLFKKLKMELDSWERSNEQLEDEELHKSFKRLQRMAQRRNRVIEANEEWRKLPFKSHDGIKVAFYDDDDYLCDVWYFEEEPMPRLNCRKWMSVLDEIEQRRKKAKKAFPKQKCPKWLRVLDEIRQIRVEEEEGNMSRVALQEEEDKEEEREEEGVLKGRKENHGDAMSQNAAASFSDDPKVLLLLAVGMALCVSLWF